MKRDEKEAKNKYEIIAEYYHNLRTKEYPEGWFYNEMLEMPATLKLLGNVKGKKVLDFGCGTGIYTKILKKKGAKIKGFDISPKMLKIAKEYVSRVDLREGSGYNIPFKEKFDVIVAPLILDYFSDWDKVFRQVKKVLKKDGYFIFSIGNPISESTKKTNKNNHLIREFHGYFKERKIYKVWKNILHDKKVRNIKMPTYHKTYETIIRTILKNGFEIVDYKDAFPLKKAKRLFPGDYKFTLNFPYFCVWKVRKK